MKVKARYIRNTTGQLITTKLIKASDVYFSHPSENEVVLTFKIGRKFVNVPLCNVLWYEVEAFKPIFQEEESKIGYE